MFRIMPLLYNAELQKAQAEADFAQIEFQNTKKLTDSNVVSPNELALAKAKYDKAKAELAKSEQYKDGFDIQFVYVNGLEEERQTGQIMLDQLSKLNINVEVVGMEWANAVALFADQETSPAMFPIYSGSDYPDADNYLWQSFHSSSAGTWTGADHYNNPKVDDLLVQGRTTFFF